MVIQLSPGVSVVEVDLTTIVPAVSSTAGGYVGFFRWGPVNQRLLIDSEFTMSTTFQPPNSNNAVFYYTASNILSYGNVLWCVRANSAGLLNADGKGASNIMLPNETAYQSQYFNGNAGTYGQYFARYPGDLGNSLVVAMCPSTAAFQSNLTSVSSITANANPGNNSVVLSSNATGNVIVGDFIQVGTGASSNGYVQITAINGTTITTADGPVALSGTALAVSRKWQYAYQFSAPPSTSSYANNKSALYDQIHMVVIDANGSFNGATTGNFILEKYPFLSKASDARNADSSPAFYPQVLFNQSKYIYWADHPVGTTNWGNTAQGVTFTAPALPTSVLLTGGSDMTQPYNYTNFASNGIADPNDAGLIAGYTLFQNTEDVDVSLLPLGAASVTVQQWVIDNIANNRRDCVVFISPRYQDVVNQQGNEPTNIVNNYLPALNRQSSYVVLDSGWKYQFDRWNQIYRFMPLNADVAGLCIRTDTVRDPWWSPAGYNRGQILNLAQLAWNPSNTIKGGIRDFLYVNGVNPVVSFAGQGTVLFGDKTLQSQPSAFDRINVRRLFIVLEKAVSTAAKYSLFEFNDTFTRAAFVNAIEPYLRTVKGRRGIFDYKVVCDETNNTPDIIDADQFVGDIYVKPSRSVNFITLHFIAVGTGVNFDTIVGAF